MDSRLKEDIADSQTLDLSGRQQAPVQRWGFSGPMQFKVGVWILLFVVFSGTFWFWLARREPQIFRENGPMENFQLVSLAAGILFFLLAEFAVRSNWPRRVFLGGLMLFYGTLAMLEFDVREFHITGLTWLLNGKVRNLWMCLLWLGAFLLFLRQARAVWMEFRNWLSTRAGMLLLVAGVFWTLGGIIDRLKFLPSLPQNLMAEELLEANAAPLMLVSAILTWRSVIKARSSNLPQAASPLSNEPIGNTNRNQSG